MVTPTDTFNINRKTIEPIIAKSSVPNSPSIAKENDDDVFSAIFQSAVSNLNRTNNYLSDAENEEIRLALGQTDNTHDLAIALQKASTALQYTVAIRDKFLESYKEIMNMQI